MKPLEVDIMSSHTTAEVGDNVDITCVSKDDYKPKPSFAILVNGQVALCLVYVSKIVAQLFSFILRDFLSGSHWF